jgi:hypothetical protein
MFNVLIQCKRKDDSMISISKKARLSTLFTALALTGATASAMEEKPKFYSAWGQKSNPNYRMTIGDLNGACDWLKNAPHYFATTAPNTHKDLQKSCDEVSQTFIQCNNLSIESNNLAKKYKKLETQTKITLAEMMISDNNKSLNACTAEALKDPANLMKYFCPDFAHDAAVYRSYLSKLEKEAQDQKKQ